MCTAAAYKTDSFYFGRTLDNDFSYVEEITITPRNFPFSFKKAAPMSNHYAIIGMAHISENYPLYYEAVNEKGLGVAGLNFVGNAVYHPEITGKYNITPYEFIPWILGQCDSVKEAEPFLREINFLDSPFSESMPLAQLHWFIADRDRALTVESTAEGAFVYDNPVGVLTNNPGFNEQMFNLNNYMGLSAREPENRFSPALPLHVYSRGMGALGLPGDLSSQSRFVRAAFVKMNSVSGDSEAESVSQFFHILGSVEQQRGCCKLNNGGYEITVYTSCCNAEKGVYYYTSYDNHQITAVDMHREDLNSTELVRYLPIHGEQIKQQN